MKDKTILSNLGTCVREMRLKRGLSQRELAEKVGASEQYISTIECGRRNITFIRLVRIVHVLGGPVHKLFFLLPSTEEEGAMLLNEFMNCSPEDKRIVEITIRAVIMGLKHKSTVQKADEERDRMMKELGGY